MCLITTWQGKCWNEALIVAARAGYTKERELEISQQLVTRWSCVGATLDMYYNAILSLLSDHRYADAAVLLEEYLEDHERAVAVLISGCHWVMPSAC